MVTRQQIAGYLNEHASELMRNIPKEKVEALTAMMVNAVDGSATKLAIQLDGSLSPGKTPGAKKSIENPRGPSIT